VSARKDARLHLAGLLEAALVGNGKPAQAVYPYQVGDFRGQTPVVVVASGPAEHLPNGFGCSKASFQLLVYVFVAYAAAGGWTEEQAEDALDDIEAIIADVIGANGRTDAWVQIGYSGPTQPDPVVIGGVEYRRELITLDVQVF
jgi:hypothetical protein